MHRDLGKTDNDRTGLCAQIEKVKLPKDVSNVPLNDLKGAVCMNYFEEDSFKFDLKLSSINLRDLFLNLDVFKDNYNNDLYVKMPFSTQNEQKWNIINKMMQNRIKYCSDIEQIIESYYDNQDTENYRDVRLDFSSLREYFKLLTRAEQKMHFDILIPKMQILVKDTPSLIPPLPLLTKTKNFSITLSQYQVASLLANGFFCTFPVQSNIDHKNSFPNFNFNQLFSYATTKIKLEKLRCIFNYFQKILLNNTKPENLITYTRRCIHQNDLPFWSSKNIKFSKLTVYAKGYIEDCKGSLQVDFANAFVGGGVLNTGSVQEEIKFLTCPELILSRLFTERLENNEVLIVTGYERFSNYTGYAREFKYAGNFNDDTEIEMTEYGPRRLSYMVAMNAIKFHDPKLQYIKSNINRELNKAYIGFRTDAERLGEPVPVTTGNWGCGAYKGDHYLKCLIQLMAASACNRDIIYFTFGDEKLCKEITEMYKFITDKNINVDDLYKKILNYNNSIKRNNSINLFAYLYNSM